MASDKNLIARVEHLDKLIYEIRGFKVMLDMDLSEVYGVSTAALNQAVKRNVEQFPPDFMFRLSKKEMANWMSQIVISNPSLKMGLRKRPYAFTEHGAIMAANVLKSPRARQMSVFVVRAFIRMRSLLSERHELAIQLASLEKKLTRRLDSHEIAIVDVLRRVMKLLEPIPPPSKLSRRRIGFRSTKAQT